MFALVYYFVFFFFFKQKTAYEMLRSLVGSEMCIRDRFGPHNGDWLMGGCQTHFGGDHASVGSVAVLRGMTKEEQVAVLGAMAPHERAAAVAAMSPEETSDLLASMAPAERETAMATLSHAAAPSRRIRKKSKTSTELRRLRVIRGRTATTPLPSGDRGAGVSGPADKARAHAHDDPGFFAVVQRGAEDPNPGVLGVPVDVRI
eukprot:TRINITY_DN3656_c0_g1_i1.p1 TRINITY_DN3656_c0_g1~~TRINITY_DN3656_c0_g1_i1.p1  ORF type:complete len:203 (+),score=41.47 TRINITY_DN3656_c0_g1_i1:50-658(+)